MNRLPLPNVGLRRSRPRPLVLARSMSDSNERRVNLAASIIVLVLAAGAGRGSCDRRGGRVLAKEVLDRLVVDLFGETLFGEKLLGSVGGRGSLSVLRVARAMALALWKSKADDECQARRDGSAIRTTRRA